MPNILQTGDITMPRELAGGIWQKAQKGSVIAALSGAEPQKFGEKDIMTFEAVSYTHLGWTERPGKGSHVIFEKDGKTVSVPTSKDPIKLGTYLEIAKQAGWR